MTPCTEVVDYQHCREKPASIIRIAPEDGGNRYL
jgi:hypothetical protein